MQCHGRVAKTSVIAVLNAIWRAIDMCGYRCAPYGATIGRNWTPLRRSRRPPEIAKWSLPRAGVSRSKSFAKRTCGPSNQFSGEKCCTDNSARIIGDDTPSLSSAIHPMVLVRIVADKEVNLAHMIDLDYPLHQFRGQQRTSATVGIRLVVGKLKDACLLVADDPYLRGDWASIKLRNTHA